MERDRQQLDGPERNAKRRQIDLSASSSSQPPLTDTRINQEGSSNSCRAARREARIRPTTSGSLISNQAPPNTEPPHRTTAQLLPPTLNQTPPLATPDIIQPQRNASMRELRATARSIRLTVPDQTHTPPDIQLPTPLRKIAWTTNIPSQHDLGPMHTVCSNCDALLWQTEQPPKCCSHGKVSLPLMPAPPPLLMHLYTTANPTSTEFRQSIRKYNNALAFGSLAIKTDRRITNTPGGPYTLRVNGRMSHIMGGLQPDPNTQPIYAQIYILDNAEQQLDRRQEYVPALRRDTLRELQQLITLNNPFARAIHNTSELMRIYPTLDIRLQIQTPTVPNARNRQYNAPTSNEIALLMPNDPNPIEGHQNIIIHSRDGTLQSINECHSSYDPLHFVLMFPYGTDGWHIGIPQRILEQTQRERNVTALQFYSYHLHLRPHHVSPIHYAGRLFQEYICTAFAKIEQGRLNYVRMNQQIFRAEIRQGVEDAIGQPATTASNIGRRIILPSSHTGSPRNTNQLYHDAIAIVRTLGKPDYFITMTANQSWIEITRELLERQTPSDRPDLIARVFQMKLKELLDLLIKKEILGAVIGKIYVIEFQKRGLPHAHLLLMVRHSDKPQTPADYDKVVSAELPDQQTDPELYNIVTSSMIHGPCGPLNPQSPCMKDGRCTKHYPKEFQEETTIHGGKVKYRRRDNGRYIIRNGSRIDNRWVVPHNKWLSTYFKCHINVEICAHIRSVKYLYKYIYKGPDMISATLEYQNLPISRTPAGTNQDEIAHYLNARYFSAIEASWRILSYDLQEQEPHVVRLAVHLPNQNVLHFRDDDDLNNTHQRGAHTTLTRYFEKNIEEERAHQYLYQDFPTSYTWQKSSKTWTIRQNHQRMPTIGRMYFANPNEGERYYLRLLLANIRGATSFEHLRTVNNILHPTFKDACNALMLLNDDTETLQSLLEASTWKMPAELRQLFATLLILNRPTNAIALWNAIEYHLAEDYQQQQNAAMTMITDHITPHAKQCALHDVEKHMKSAGQSLQDFGFIDIEIEPTTNTLILEEMQHENQQQTDVARAVQLLNPEQLLAFHEIIAGINATAGNQHFVYGAGGTGKTFLYNTLLSHTRSQGKIALAVASSGIASILLTGGRTAHSRFKIPLELHDSSTCNIPRQSETAALLRATHLIVWDEAPMAHKHAFEALDRTLRDITEQDTLFGGITVVLGGDFKQLLPVVPHGTKPDIIDAAINKSYIWSHIKVHRLTTNMRARQSNTTQTDQNIADFSNWLQSIGEGREQTYPERGENIIKMPINICIPTQNLMDLITTTFAGIQDTTNNRNFWNTNFWTERAILTPLNEHVDEINSIITDLFPGDPKTYLSADRIIDEDNQQLYPAEFLNTQTPSGMPPHKLTLKIGMIIMLLRTTSTKLGLYNGTRLIIRAMGERILDTEIVTGNNIGQRVFIPRIPLTPGTAQLPFHFERTQFPIRPAFAMTINKAQGQTLKQLGLYLPRPVFGHGQLYVALSRARRQQDIKVLIIDQQGQSMNDNGIATYTANVVYKEAL